MNTIATGPFKAAFISSEAWAIVDECGNLFATVHGEHAHHDAPILASALSEHVVTLDRLSDAEARVESLTDELTLTNEELSIAESELWRIQRAKEEAKP